MSSLIMAQEVDQINLPVVDDKYLEDQFYFGTGINFLLDKPDEVGQNSLSYSLQMGFIKDIPLNQRRNMGLGIGLGYAANSFYNNVRVTEGESGLNYDIISSADFKRNKLETHTVEMPIQLRWRTSNATEYKFWRLYTGLRLGYVFSGRSKFVDDVGSDAFSNDGLEPFQYGVTVNFGYNTLNLHAYYGLNRLLKDGIQTEDGTEINFRVLRVGIMFYIL
ncbi:MAG: porin family protein [Bacteroidota bacterium]